MSNLSSHSANLPVVSSTPAAISTPRQHDASLKLYLTLANRRWPRTYRGKIMFVAFLGTHIPLLTLLGMAVLHSALSPQAKVQVLLVSLAATLVGTAATLFLLNRLLAPVLLTGRSLRRYLENKERPTLPTRYQDEAGVLMADTMQTVGQLDDMIEYLSGYDALTGLPNRDSFKKRLDQAVGKAKRQSSGFAVLIVDMDKFALVNTFGHEMGDRMLREVARRLLNCAAEDDVVARLGGDQFAILHVKSTDPEGVVAQAQCILAELRRPYALNEVEWPGTACIGIALFPEESAGGHVLEHADAALHDAKANGANTYQFFAVESNEKLCQRLALGLDLHGALERGEFVLHYQPQIDSVLGSIAGLEALVRWQHPERGLIAPGDFIPIAEATGLIVPLGEWVLRTACAQNKAWQDAGLPPCRVAVNLSARQFQHPDMVSNVVAILKETGLAAEYLELEVTESMVMSDVESAIGVLQELHSHGIELSLDDFGTGYSSLSYLKRFPLHTLKIDRSFVRDILEDANDAVLTSSIIALAKNMGLGVIAEGVETQEQSDYLQEHGCHKLQGFLFSRPVSAEQCEQVMRNYAAQCYAVR